MKKPVIIFFLFFLSLGMFQPVAVQAGIKETTSNNVIHYELDEIKLQGVETQDRNGQLHTAPYRQKDCKVKLKAQSELVHGQYHICLVLNLENPKYELGNCYISLVKYYKDKSDDEYLLFPLIENYNIPPLMQWVRNLENAWGIKYPSTLQFDCYEGQSKYELYFLLTLADFEDLVTAENLGLFIHLNHSTLSYQIKNMKELRELNQKVMAVAKQPVPTNNAPVYSPEILNNAEQLRGLLGKNLYSPEVAGLLAKLGRKEAIYGQTFYSYYYKEKGISITVAYTGEIANIGLHNPDTMPPGDYKPYQGELPGGITFTAQRRGAEEKLGPPSGIQLEKPGRFYAAYPGFIINYSNKYSKDGKLTAQSDYAISSVILTPDAPAPAKRPAAPVDPRDYISLLGQSIMDPKIQLFVKGLGAESVSSAGNYVFYYYPEHDAYLLVDTATSVIQTLWFRPNASGFQPYRGSFEGEIWLLDTRKSVEEKLGEPIDWGNSDSGAFWAKYPTGAKIHYQYLAADNMDNPVTMIEFSLENQPPAQPGVYLLNLLGKKYDSPELSAFFGTLYDHSIMKYDDFVAAFTNQAFQIAFWSDGVELHFADPKAPWLTTIYLESPFTGSLPGGITFSDDRESIKGKLGNPVDSFGDKNPVDRFLIGTKYELSVVYYTPDKSPGKFFPERIYMNLTLEELEKIKK